MEIGHKREQDVGGWIIIRWIWERQDWVVLTGLVSLKIGTIGWLL
jgi:hypothetical protein